MNHIYRSIWNATLGCWVAAPENARSGGKASSRSATTTAGGKSRSALAVLPLVMACALAWPVLGHSGEQYWDGNQSVANGITDGGSGTWIRNESNWTDVNGIMNDVWNQDIAVFQGAAGTVNVDDSPPVGGMVESHIVGGMRFVSDGYILQDGSLELKHSSGNSDVEVAPGSVATINTALVGDATLVKKGAGTLVLNAANSYEDGTALEGGTIVVGNNAALGSEKLTVSGGTELDSNTAVTLINEVTLNGSLNVRGSNALTLNGAIDGTGGLTKSGTANLTLGGNNSFSGPLSLTAGGLILGSNSAMGAATLSVYGGTTLDSSVAVDVGNTIHLLGNLGIVGSNNLALSGTIQGFGSLSKYGTANLTLNGSNDFIGGVTLNSGTLTVGHNYALGLGFLTVDGASMLDSNSAVTLGNDVTLNTNLSVGGSNDLTLGGVISGNGGLLKNGAAKLILNGSNTYDGGTLISNGTLVAGHAGALGRGNVTVANGAALEVIGRTFVNDDLTFNPGSTYRVYADPAGSAKDLDGIPLDNSWIGVLGTATLAGSVLHVGPQPDVQTGFQVGKTYTILSALDGVVGSFGSVASDYAFLDASLSVVDSAVVGFPSTAKDVLLELKRKTSGGNNSGGQMHFADLANTSNQGSTANALESLPSTYALYQYVETLPAGTPPAVFSSLSGDTHSTVSSSVNMLGAHAPNISQQHLRSNMTAGFRAGAPIAQSDGPLPASALPSSKALPAWVEVVGHWQKMDGNSNTPGVKQNTTGLFLGADEEVGNSGWRVGGSVGYTSADAKVNSRDASADISSYSAAVYTGKGFSHAGNRINVIGGLAYTKHSIESERSVAALGQNLKADYSAHTAQLFAEVGYAMGQYDKQGFEPFVGITLGEQRSDSFKESGGFAALSSESSRDTLASTTLGVRAHSDFKLAGKNTRVRGSLGVRHAWGNLSQNRTMAFEGSSSFTVAGAPLARNTALVGLQAEMELSRNAALVLGYNGEYGSGSRDQSASVKVRWAF